MMDYTYKDAVFGSVSELRRFLNENAIPREDIVFIGYIPGGGFKVKLIWTEGGTHGH